MKTYAKVGMARHPPCPQSRIFLLVGLNPLQFLAFHSETADEPEKSYVPLTKTVVRNNKLSTDEAAGENAPFPYLTTVTQLRVTKIT
jgi:hypothetical protein